MLPILGLFRDIPIQKISLGLDVHYLEYLKLSLIPKSISYYQLPYPRIVPNILGILGCPSNIFGRTGHV